MADKKIIPLLDAILDGHAAKYFPASAYQVDMAKRHPHLFTVTPAQHQVLIRQVGCYWEDDRKPRCRQCAECKEHFN